MSDFKVQLGVMRSQLLLFVLAATAVAAATSAYSPSDGRRLATAKPLNVDQPESGVTDATFVFTVPLDQASRITLVATKGSDASKPSILRLYVSILHTDTHQPAKEK